MTNPSVQNAEIHKILRYEGVRIAQKGEWQVWYHHFVGLFFWIVGLFNKPLKDNFYNNYHTVVGRVIYLADLQKYIDSPEKYEPTLWHEYQHILQFESEGIFYYLKYMLLPKKRAEYEYEAYSRTILSYMGYGKTFFYNVLLARISKHFKKGSIYMMNEVNPEKVLETIFSTMVLFNTNHETFNQDWPKIWKISSVYRNDREINED
jgi:hypothetical protein